MNASQRWLFPPSSKKWHVRHVKLEAMAIDPADPADPARIAAANAALALVPENTTIGLGSGRAVFALIERIGEKWNGKPPIKAIVASSTAANLATKAGIELVDLTADQTLDIAFDGADEVDPQLNLIKGGGAALLREKLVIAAAKQVIIVVQDSKLVDRLGQTRLLPVEIVRFGWQTTRARLLQFVDDAQLRVDENSEPVITDEGHYLLDVPVPPVLAGDIHEFAGKLKATLGIVDHGLFIDLANKVLVGHDDGSITTITQ